MRGTPLRRSMGKVFVAGSYCRFSALPAGISITAFRMPGRAKAGMVSRSFMVDEAGSDGAVQLMMERVRSTVRTMPERSPLPINASGTKS